MKEIIALLLSLSSQAVLCISLCGCGTGKERRISDTKVLLTLSLEDRDRLLTRVGFTNAGRVGPLTRDSSGQRMFMMVETTPFSGQAQESRTQQLIVITAQGFHVKPWHFPANERVGDNEELTVWEHPKPDYKWEVRSGKILPQNSRLADASGEWIAIHSHDRAPWIARLDTPDVVAAELPKSPGLIRIFARGEVVHVFSRAGWRNADGPMTYSVYDFSVGNKAITAKTIPWARIALDMDPDTQYAVLNDNNRFWGRTWLLNLKSGKRTSISMGDWILFVNKDVAEKCLQLMNP
jgi:hypothetical protein